MQYKDYLREKFKHTEIIAETEGYPCIVETNKSKPLKDYRIYGNSIQNGTPSPDNPIEIQSVGEKTKNLFDIENMEYIHYGSANYYPKVENGLFISPGITGVSFYWMPVIKIKPLTTYTVSFEEISGVTNRGIILYDDMNKTNPIGIYKNEFIGSKCIFTITTSDTGNYLSIAVSGNALYTAIISNIQIEEGGIATEYEPYGKYKIPIEVSGRNPFDETKIESQTYNIFLDEPLSNTTDYMDYKKQQLITSQGITKIELPTIQLNKGTNIITTKTEIAPSNIWCKYIK